MRQKIVRAEHIFLDNPIQKVIDIGKRIEEIGGFQMIWKNIGDPVAAGEMPPEWITEILKEKIPESYEYTSSRGHLEARKYVLENFSNKKICSTEDILFFNGLGDAINKIMSCLPKEARVLVPDPNYMAHATAEALHSGYQHISYPLNPEKDWEPDLEDLENLVVYNDRIVAILIINPNNPTGKVYSRKTLEKIVSIAKQNNCFIIADEIYHAMVFGEIQNTPLHEVIDDVPGISLKGISKEIPWPGSRCGWAEFYNVEKDLEFSRYFETILLTKSIEVCSTTLPQKSLSAIYSSNKYKPYLESRLQKYKRRADEAFKYFSSIPNIRVSKPDAVFFMIVEFLDIKNSILNSVSKDVRLFLDDIYTDPIPADFKFSYELMGSEGICVVPLSGFSKSLHGFRMTLLQEDDAIFTNTLDRIGRAITEWYK